MKPQYNPAVVIAEKWLEGVKPMEVFKPEAFTDQRFKDGLIDFFQARAQGPAGFENDNASLNQIFKSLNDELFDYLTAEFKVMFV